MFHQVGEAVELIADIAVHQALLGGENEPDGTGAVDDVIIKNCQHVVFASTNIQASTIKSYIYGYKINQGLKDYMRQYFTMNPFAVAGELAKGYTFPNTPNDRGIDTQINIPLIGVVEVNALFPQSTKATTCFINPKLKNLSLKFLDMSFPDTAVNTTEPQYFKSQLEANMLGEPLQCSNQFGNSYLVNYSGKRDERYYTHTDITNFVHTVPIEIPSSNSFFCEGVNSTSNTVIALTADAIKQGEEEVYANVARDDGYLANNAPPIFVAISNTFWCFYLDDRGVPVCEYDINNGWNQFFQRRFPALYQQLMAGN
jgi:hypothetical protein